MDHREWSRSRYWLCHFLQSRHEREAIAWQTPAAAGAPLPANLQGWLRGAGQVDADAARWLIEQTARQCAADPAYVQALRLWVKERHHHAKLLQQARGRFGLGATRPWRPPLPALRRPLGLRFELANLMLGEIIAATVHEAASATTTDPVLSAVLAQIQRDQRAHLSFHAERLTHEFADFNFVRRNLRRLRLRGLFAADVAAAAWRHRALLRAAGWTRYHFARTCWARFESVLERVVPYHREALLAALVWQKDRPYDKPM